MLINLIANNLRKWKNQPILMPEKPIKAIASRPATTSAIGTPFIERGTSAIASCVRIAEKISNAIIKPKAVDMA